jgi:hypothetical protein
VKLLLKRVFLCLSAVGSAHAVWAQDWEHIRVIGQRLGLPRVVNIGSPPSQAIAIGDFDGDGDADIAVSGTGARRVTVLLGDASSPFTASLVAPRTDWPTVDADTTVAGVDYRIQSSPLSAMTTVMSPGDIREGRPEGRPPRIPTLRTPAIVGDFDADGVVEITAGPPGSSALAIGDFDADGFADLIASTERSASLTLRFGDAQGRFSTRRTIDVGVMTAAGGLAAGDINDDGVSDVALLSDSDTVSVLIGDGAGGLVPMVHMTVGRSPPAATAALASTSAPPAEYQGIATLTLNPTTIAGGSGATSTGTITLNAPAPAGGVVVALTSSNIELAASESTITVPAGASTASVTIGTNRNYRRYSGLAFSVTISATHGTTTRSAALAVTAQPRPGTLSSFDVQNRGQMCFGVGVRQAGSGYELEFGSAGNLFDCVPPSNPVGQDGTCTFRQECALGCELRAPNGSTFRDVCATAGPFPVAVNPKLLLGGNESVATLRLNAAAPANSSGTLSSMTVLANTIPNIPTPIPAGATTATANVLTARVASPQFAPIDGHYLTPLPDGSRSGRIGLTWLALTPGAAPPFRLTSLTFDPPSLTSVVGGATLFAFGQMNQVAPAPAIATATMTVTSSHPSVVSIPQPNVSITEGSSSAGVGLQTHAVAADTLVTLSAALGETTLTRQLLVTATPGATQVDHFFLDPLDVPGGTPSTATVVLNGMASSGGVLVTLQSSNTAVVTMPASITVPAGSDRVNFTVTTAPVSASTSVNLTARFNGTFAATSLLVTASGGSPSPPPPPPSQATLTVTASGRSGERVTSSPAGINVAVGSTGSASFTTSTSITLSVSNGRDAIWSGACSSSGSKRRTCTFTLSGTASVTANVQ